MNATPSDFEASGDVGYDTILKTFRKRWRTIFLITLICSGLGLVYALISPKIYRAKATLQIDLQGRKVIDVQDASDAKVTLPAEYLKTVEESLQTASLFRRVIKVNDLMNSPEFMPHGWGNGKPSEIEVNKAFADMVEIKLHKGTFLVDISVDHTSRDFAERIEKSLIEEYFKMISERRGGSTEADMKFLMEEDKRLQGQLHESELRLQSFKEKYESVSFEDDKGNTVLEKLRHLSQDVTEAKTERIRREAEFDQIKAAGEESGALLKIPVVANYPGVLEANRALDKATEEVNGLLERYKEKHPQMIDARKRRAEKEQQIQAAVKEAVEIAQKNTEKARQIEEQLTTALKEQEQVALSFDKLKIEFKVLQRDLDSNQKLYEKVSKRLSEIDLTKNLDSTNITLIEPVFASTKPVKPRLFYTLLIAVGSGLLMGITWAFVKTLMDSTINETEEIERLIQKPLLGVVPRLPKNYRSDHKLILLDQPQSAAAEAIRFLRASLTSLPPHHERRVILLTSALPNEGKTFMASNLAVSLARQKWKTLLIEGDLRHPGLTRLFPEVAAKEGLKEFLRGQDILNEIIHPTNVENLFLITAGSASHNPADLFGSDRFSVLLHKVSASFDRIILDSAPVNLVSDTLLMSKHVQSVGLVVRSGKTPQKEIEKACQLLTQAYAPLVGIILNDFPADAQLKKYNSYYTEMGDETLRKA